jgi:hypothetical protein
MVVITRPGTQAGSGNQEPGAAVALGGTLAAEHDAVPCKARTPTSRSSQPYTDTYFYINEKLDMIVQQKKACSKIEKTVIVE